MIVSTDITLADYHASDYVSHSKLRTFADLGPAAYRARHLVGEWREKTSDAMRFGQAFETFVQDPEGFARTYKELPTIEGKADDAILAEAAALGLLSDDGKPFSRRHGASTVQIALIRARGENVIERADMVRIERMAESFFRNADAQAVIRGLSTQVTLRMKMDHFPGLQSRPDWYDANDFGGRSVDLKVTGEWGRHDSNGADLVRKLMSNGAHTQAAIIEAIAGTAERLVIACEDNFPWRCTVVDLVDLMPAANEWRWHQLAALDHCYQNDEWPACPTKIRAKLPGYLARKANEDGW